MKYKAFDIETVQDESIIDSLPKPEVALGNLKDPVKIREKIEAARENQLKYMATSPYTGRVCCFAVHSEDRSFYKVVEDESEASEIELLYSIIEEINRSEGEIFVTHNGMEFDFPFIYDRIVLLKLELPQFFPPLTDWTRKYSTSPHLDMLKMLSNWGPNTKGLNLDFLGNRVLGRGKTDRDYSTYLDLIKSGKGDLIGIDCLCDVKLTLDLFNTYKGVRFECA